MSRGDAPVEHPIHELLVQRHSPYAFDPDRPVSAEDLVSLFEAARWTMSSYNAQPWRYIVAARDRDPQTWERIYNVLVDGNQPWAGNAPVLARPIQAEQVDHRIGGHPGVVQSQAHPAAAGVVLENVVFHRVAGFVEYDTVDCVVHRMG